MRKRRIKSALKWAAITALAVVICHVVSMLTLDRRIEYRQVAFHSAKLTQAMDGYKVAFVTDTHAIPGEALLEVALQIDAWEPDLLLLGGDFPSAQGAPDRSMDNLSAVNAPDGTYGVEGNHDDYVALFEAMDRHGMHPLSNSGAHVRDGFYVAGVEDMWNREPSIAAATAGAAADDFVLLIAHNPDVTMVQDSSSADLILSGHTHGGQITLFGLWAPALTLSQNITKYGQRFMSGWSTSQSGTPVYVSNGTGTFQSVPRVFARPQVIYLTLYSTP